MFKNGMIVGLLIILGAVAVFTRNGNIVQQRQVAQITQLTARVDSLVASNAELSVRRTQQEASALLYVTALRMAEQRIYTGQAPTFEFLSDYIDQMRKDFPTFNISGSLDPIPGNLELSIDDEHDTVARVAFNLKHGSPITRHVEFER